MLSFCYLNLEKKKKKKRQTHKQKQNKHALLRESLKID